LTIARAPSDVLDWLAGTPKPWHEQIAFVAIDMSPGYRAAIRTGLPHAQVVVDHFHIVQLANRMLNLVHHRHPPRASRPGLRPGMESPAPLPA
jgi:transposase